MTNSVELLNTLAYVTELSVSCYQQNKTRSGYPSNAFSLAHNEEMIQNLIESLHSDGYTVMKGDSVFAWGHDISRRLGESGPNATAIIMVLVCVTCAALASGLTQVLSRLAV